MDGNKNGCCRLAAVVMGGKTRASGGRSRRSSKLPCPGRMEEDGLHSSGASLMCAKVGELSGV